MMKKTMLAAMFSLVSIGATAQGAPIDSSDLAMRPSPTPSEATSMWGGQYAQFKLRGENGESAQALWGAASKVLGAQTFSQNGGAWIAQAPGQTEEGFAKALSRVGFLSEERASSKVSSALWPMRFSASQDSRRPVGVSCSTQGADAQKNSDCAQIEESIKNEWESSFAVIVHFIGSQGAIVDWERSEQEGNALSAAMRNNKSAAKVDAGHGLVFAEANGDALRVSIFTFERLPDKKDPSPGPTITP